MTCEMCGATDSSFRVLVEGTNMSVCKNCSKFGKVIRAPPPVSKYKNKKWNKPKREIKKEPVVEIIEAIVEGFGMKIKNKRENLNLKQIELAKMIAEKESMVQKIESGHVQPSIAFAKKLEKVLKIKLIEKIESETGGNKVKSKSGPLTIGDMLNVKK